MDPTTEVRRRFLIGEGTLTAAEVADWAMEMSPPSVPIPANIGEDDCLMVARVESAASTHESGREEPHGAQ